MSFDEQRARDEEQRARDEEQRARDEEQRIRDDAQRERDFFEHIERQREELRRAHVEGERSEDLRERERELNRLIVEHERQRDRERRERERERRREERHHERHRQRHEFRFGRRGFDINVDVDADEIARSVGAAFVGMDDEEDGGESHDQTIEKTFTVDAMPRLRVQNVSGETSIHVGEPGQVKVVARKRVKGGSSDRAKRLLENVEVRIEQRGNDIFVEPHLYEQERSWLDLFRGKRFRVDFDITVPRETAVNAQTVSGDLELRGTRGPTSLESVSGDVNIADLQGPMRLKSVSGDVQCSDYVGAVEGSSVSGDVDIRGRVRTCELHTVSGDISVDLEPETGRESRLKTISGDVDLGLLTSSCVCEFHTASGDLDCETPARIMREGRKDRTIVIGDGRSRLYVKTVSGDLTIKQAWSAVQEEPSAVTTEAAAEGEAVPPTDPERTAPMAPPASAKVRDLLERLARGEASVDEVASKLDETRKGF